MGIQMLLPPTPVVKQMALLPCGRGILWLLAFEALLPLIGPWRSFRTMNCFEGYTNGTDIISVELPGGSQA